MNRFNGIACIIADKVARDSPLGSSGDLHNLPSEKGESFSLGGEIASVQIIDASKEITADFRHRALRHHAEGVFMAVTWTGKRKGAGVLGRNRPTAALPKKLAVVGLFRVQVRISFQFLAEVS